MGSGRVLVISDGGTTGLLATAAAADRGPGRSGEPGPVVWLAPIQAGVDAQVSRRAGERQAELFGLSAVDGLASGWRGGAPGTPEGEIAAQLHAGFAAADVGARTVVWPRSAGEGLDLDGVSRAVDQALVVTRLLRVALGEERAPEVRAPYADFTDAQVADLILDMDLPVWTCWWWVGEEPAARAERERWMGALRRAGWTGALPGPEIVTRTTGARKPA